MVDLNSCWACGIFLPGTSKAIYCDICKRAEPYATDGRIYIKNALIAVDLPELALGDVNGFLTAFHKAVEAARLQQKAIDVQGGHK